MRHQIMCLICQAGVSTWVSLRKCFLVVFCQLCELTIDEDIFHDLSDDSIDECVFHGNVVEAANSIGFWSRPINVTHSNGVVSLGSEMLRIMMFLIQAQKCSQC